MSNGCQDITGVLIASPNSSFRGYLLGIVNSYSWPAEQAYSGADALEKLEASECELLLLDENLPDLNTSEVRGFVKQHFPGIDVLMVDSETGRAAPEGELKKEATKTLLRMFNSEIRVQQPASSEMPPPRNGSPKPLTPASAKASSDELPGMKGDTEAVRKMYRMVRLVAPRDTAVLLLGECGTGKDLVANAIHKLSPRASQPFVVINCAAIPETLLESELFGYTRGAFTGAAQSRVGRIHAAQGGTLFLDEIGDLPLNLQAKLLRFLESGEVQRLGSSDVFKVDVRVIAATNADLQKKVASGEFRKDLFYRLSVFPIMLPPLRSRKDDIPGLANHFLEMLERRPIGLSTEAAAVLEAYDWPGNVRELKHVIERAIILAENDQTIGARHIMIMSPDS